MMLGLYRLRGHEVEPLYSVCEWGRWFETADLTVALTALPFDDVDDAGEARISTVFLGIDHGFGPGEPVVFETMVFVGSGEADFSNTFDRYRTWADAEAGHARIVATTAAAIADLQGRARAAVASLGTDARIGSEMLWRALTGAAR